MWRGEAFFSVGDPTSGVADYEMAARLAPQTPAVHLHLADGCLATKNYDRALAECNVALRLNPRDPNAYGLRSRVYAAMGRQELAETDQRQAVRLNPART